MGITEVTNSLFRTAVTDSEENKTDEDCGFYHYSGPQDEQVFDFALSAPAEASDNYDDEDEDYEDEDYDIDGSCMDSDDYDKFSQIRTILNTVNDYVESEDHYFYDSELNEMREVMAELLPIAERLKQISSGYRYY